MKKFILLIISFLSISNFIFAGERKEQKEQVEITADQAAQAIRNNDIKTVERFLNQKKENIIAMANDGSFYDDFLFAIAIRRQKFDIAELFVLRGFFDFLKQEYDVKYVDLNYFVQLIFYYYLERDGDQDNAIRWLQLLINGVDIQIIYDAFIKRFLLGQYDAVEYFIFSRIPFSHSRVPYIIGSINRRLSDFRKNPFRQRINDYLLRVYKSLTYNADASFVEAINNLIDKFEIDLWKFDPNDSQAIDKIMKSFNDFAKAFDLLEATKDKKIAEQPQKEKKEGKETVERKETASAARLDNLGIVAKLNKISDKIADPNIKNPRRTTMLEFINHELREFLQKNLNTNFDRIEKLDKLIDTFYDPIMKAKNFEEIFSQFTKLRDEFYKLK